MRISVTSMNGIALLGMTFLATGLAARSNGFQSAQKDWLLAPNQTVERKLSRGEVHTYHIDLLAGQYLRVAVTQLGMNVILKLVGPEQQRLAEVNNENHVKGVETVTLVTELTGRYRVEVLPVKQHSSRGQYLIKIEELRMATPPDRNCVDAERAYAEGTLLEQMKTSESGRKAIEKYLEACRLYQALGEREKEATTLNSIGTVYRELGEFKKALETYQQALEITRVEGATRHEASILNNLGLVCMQRGEYQQAVEYYDQSLSLRRTIGDRVGEVMTLQSIGSYHRALGGYQKALEVYEQALQLSRVMGEGEEIAKSLSFIGLTLHGSEKYERALEVYDDVLQLYRKVGSLQGEAATLGLIGYSYNLLGEYDKALEAWKLSLSLHRAAGIRRGEAISLLGTAVIYKKLGEYEKALEYYDQALQLGQASNDHQMQAGALATIAAVHLQLGNHQKALDCFRRILPLAPFLPKDRRGRAAIFTYAAIAHGNLGHHRTAQYLFDQALWLSRSLGDHYQEAFALYSLAQLERNRGNLKDARIHIEAALEIVESMRVKITDSDLRASYLGSTHDYYIFYIDLLMRMQRAQPSEDYAAVALFASERSRARALLESLIEARADIRQGVDPALLERERTLRQQLNAKAARLTEVLSGEHSTEQADAARKEVNGLITRYQEVQTQIRATSPHYATLTQPVPLGLKEIQRQVLDDDTLLLEYSLGEERSFLWAVTTGSIASFELPRRDEIESVARRVYETLTMSHTRQHKRQAELAAAELSRMLLGPVADRLEKRRLLFVADGALQYVPFGALPEPQREEDRANPHSALRTPLIVGHEIVSLPSASVLSALRREQADHQPASRLVAVLADPVMRSDDVRVRQAKSKTKKETGGRAALTGDKRTAATDLVRSASADGVISLERLVFTRREAEAILALAHGGENLKALDFDANRTIATSPELAQYRIVHYATHGLINSQHPELSGLVLSLVDEQGRPQDGFLRIHDIYNLKLGADLVVLSACQTALGKQIKGEGIIGLVRGFMYAGAPRVVASLWDVKDEATAELMKRFYHGMLNEGLPPAAALRAAQVSMRKEPRWTAPYYWAGFVLQGEWK